MKLQDNLHLTYCTNIHPGESWEEVFENLQIYAPQLRASLYPNAPFGIGLRLSYQASQTLLAEDHLQNFKTWLDENQLYVFTMNGFPFGGFHRQRVKDDVHRPDWTHLERKEYTLNLVKILAELLPENMDGGISTSPLSYKHWFTKEEYPQVFKESTQHLLEVLEELIRVKEQTGKLIHIDIEPEPDGLIENTQEVLAYYKDYLLPLGKAKLQASHQLTEESAEACLKEHLQLCYDVCHFAVAFEDHEKSLKAFAQEGIRIGKFQISAALSAKFTDDKKEILAELSPFNESTYLHQVVEKLADQTYQQYPDLPQALLEAKNRTIDEWRIHFHVPIFLEQYAKLRSTQKDILEVLSLIKEQPYSHHLEVETYTWEVLPSDMQVDLQTSIQRELAWLKENFDLATH